MRGSWSLPRRVTRLPGTRWRSGIVTAGRWPPRSFRRNLKKLYAKLEEPRGWGGREIAELREEQWERTERNWQDSKGRAESPQKRRVEGTHSPGTASTHDGHKRMDPSTPCYGSPYKSMQSYPRKYVKYRTDPIACPQLWIGCLMTAASRRRRAHHYSADWR